MKVFLSFLLSLVFFTSFYTTSLAIYDPLNSPNNKFGIHIADTADVAEAAKLVNSSGGDWGYITLVVQENQRNKEHWQKLFDEMRKLHLIPILRIATSGFASGWKKPELGEIDSWVSFLNSLNWVIKNRYVVIANEPNHANEWGGEINPAEYASYLSIFSTKLKAVSEDFFILPAAMDASALNTKESMDESKYLDLMFKSNPLVFEQIDGWNSHSYPNPGFSGKPNAFGKGTVNTFVWELQKLKSLGLKKNLPIFITETGWIRENSEAKIGDYLQIAFQNAWSEKNIVAVTPFIFSYYDAPFAQFSWRAKEGNYYDYYYKYREIGKTKGEPVQINKGGLLASIVPPLIKTNSLYHGIIFVKNLGQSIWELNNLSLKVIEGNSINLTAVSPELILPNTQGIITFTSYAPNKSGPFNQDLEIDYQNKTIEGINPFKIEFKVYESLYFLIMQFFAKILS